MNDEQIWALIAAGVKLLRHWVDARAVAANTTQTRVREFERTLTEVREGRSVVKERRMVESSTDK